MMKAKLFSQVLSFFALVLKYKYAILSNWKLEEDVGT